MTELDSNAKENIDFYRYLSCKVTDIKIDMYKKIMKSFQSESSNLDDISDDTGIIIGTIEGLEQAIDSSFASYIWHNENQIDLYDMLIKRIDKNFKGKTNLDMTISLNFAKEVLSGIYKEWQESRKDDSNGE